MASRKKSQPETWLEVYRDVSVRKPNGRYALKFTVREHGVPVVMALEAVSLRDAIAESAQNLGYGCTAAVLGKMLGLTSPAAKACA